MKENTQWPKYRSGDPLVARILGTWVCDMDMSHKLSWFETLRWCPDVEIAFDLFLSGQRTLAVVTGALDRALAVARESLGALHAAYSGERNQ
jgi:hypothetical protein